MAKARILLVLLFSVVAIGSHHVVEIAGVTLSSLRLCDFATLRYIRGTQGRKDAMAQRMKNPFFWHPLKKPHNPSESEILIVKDEAVVAESPEWRSPTLVTKWLLLAAIGGFGAWM